MNSGLALVLLFCGVLVSADIPLGFIPLPPLPVQLNPVLPTKAPPKTPPSIPTKKPVLTKAPFKPTLPPSSSLPPSVFTPTNCQFAINVPKANCNGGNTAVQQTLNSLKQQLDKTKQQNQAQNAVVQAKISQLQSQQSGYLNKISDLQNEVKNLVTAFNSLSNGSPISSTANPLAPTPTGSSGPVNAGLQQAVLGVRNDLNQAVRDFNNKLQGINVRLQNSSLQAAQVDIQIEGQILTQGADIARMTQQIADLKKQLQQAQSKTGTGNGASSADVAKLQAQITKISADIQQYDQAQQSKYTQLNTKTNSLVSTVANHTNDIQGIRTRVLVASSRLNKLDKDTTVVHDALANFRRTANPKINQMEADIKDLTTKTTNLKKDIDRVGQSTLNILLQTSRDGQTLKGLVAQSSSLKSQIGNVSTGLTQQGKTIQAVQKNINDLKKAVPVSDLNKMNNIVLTMLNNPGQTPTPQQLTDLKDAINAITRALTTAFPSRPGSG